MRYQLLMTAVTYTSRSTSALRSAHDLSDIEEYTPAQTYTMFCATSQHTIVTNLAIQHKAGRTIKQLL